MCSTPPSWSVIMQHNDCIDIVRHTTEFYLSDTRLYRCIFIVFILWVTHQNFMCSTTPSWWVILQNNYCMDIVSNASELHVFDNPIVMGLYCRIIIVWILWVTRRNFMCSTIPSWWVILQDNYCSDIVRHTTEFICLTPGYIAAYLLYLYCESHIRISSVRHPHRDGLYCSIIIVYISWVIQRYIRLSPICWWPVAGNWFLLKPCFKSAFNSVLRYLYEYAWIG